MADRVVRGGLVLDIRGGEAAPSDILINDDTIREAGPLGLAVPEGAHEIAVARWLIHPASRGSPALSTASSSGR